MDAVTIVDGRTQRSARNREAIIDALIGCYEDGILRPSVQQVAERAGVSARSVHNHFVDVEALQAEVAQRQWDRMTPHVVPIDTSATVLARVEVLVGQRATIYESITPVRRAALVLLPDSPVIASRLARADRFMRRQVERAFPGAAPDAIDAVDALASWDVWNRMRTTQGLSVPRAQRVLVRAISAVLGAGVDEGSKE